MTNQPDPTPEENQEELKKRAEALQLLANMAEPAFKDHSNRTGAMATQATQFLALTLGLDKLAKEESV